MRRANPIENTGVVATKESGLFLGSCFIFRYPGTVLTAAHVVANTSTDLIVQFPQSMCRQRSFDVLKVQIHDEADVAVLEIVPPGELDITWPVTELFNDSGYGENVLAFGYPEHRIGPVPEVVPRLFKGYVQRLFQHRSHMGYRYLAAELSFACPTGLSGSAMTNSQYHGRLYGLIAENLNVGTELTTVHEVSDDGKEFRESIHSVINFGVAVWLPSIADWIDALVPPVPAEETHRRSRMQQQLRSQGKA